jgi:hypothetical protein
MLTIQDQINAVIAWLHENRDSLDPMACSEKLVEISVLKASLDSELALAEVAYNETLNALITTFPEKPFNKLQIQAKATPEYSTLLKKKAVAGSILEISRSIKRFQNAVSDSKELAKNF